MKKHDKRFQVFSKLIKEHIIIQRNYKKLQNLSKKFKKKRCAKNKKIKK